MNKKTTTIQIVIIFSSLMMALLLIAHIISYRGINIDHYNIFMLPVLLFFPLLFVSFFLKPRKVVIKEIPLWLKLLIVPIVIYLILLTHISSEHDRNIAGVAGMIDGKYVIHNHGIVKKIIDREYYDQLRSYFFRRCTIGLFLIYYVVTLGIFSKKVQLMRIRKVKYSNMSLNSDG